jgi:hypothetical protein
MDGAALLSAGFSEEDALTMRVFRGLSPDQVTKLQAA